MNEDLGSTGSPLVRLVRASRWIAASVLFAAVTLLAGVGLTALLGRSGAENTWDRWSAVGESFGALSAVVSGLALMAFVVTFMSQVRELKMQRAELVLQGEALDKSRAELYRNAEVGIRRLHVTLLRMAFEDERLAEVWPPLEPGLSHEQNRQYLYANLIVQHHWLCLRIGDYTEEQAESTMRYLFMSPHMRRYWAAASTARKFLVPGTDEYYFTQLVDKICYEYQTVLASDLSGRNATPAQPPPESVPRWEDLNTANG